MRSYQKYLLFLLSLILSSSTFLCYAIPSEYSILAFDHTKLPSEEEVVELFQQWKEDHEKFYRYPEEAALRLENFKRNLKYIVERNAMRNSPLGHRLGLNRFADMSNEEFKSKFISKVKKPISKSRHFKGESCEGAPYSLDWRKKGAVTGVKDQGNCGKLLYFNFYVWFWLMCWKLIKSYIVLFWLEIDYVRKVLVLAKWFTSWLWFWQRIYQKHCLLIFPYTLLNIMKSLFFSFWFCR